MVDTDPVVIVGAGPAGLACAGRLAAEGRAVTLIDDNRHPGGQYFRQLPPGYQVARNAPLLRELARAQRLFRVLGDPLVTYLPNTVAWASSGELKISYAGDELGGSIRASAVVIATGAQDAPFPFPGWTLPGVISAGGALNLAKGHGMVPEGRTVIAGNGPLVLVAGATLAAAGARVTHVVEAQPTIHVARRLASHAAAAPDLLRKGLEYRWRISRAGARFLSGRMVARAEGAEVLERVTIARVGADGRPDQRARDQIAADTLIVGYGLLPGTELARLLGCQMIHDPALGGWVPRRTTRLETSVAHVYAVGDGAAIGGVELALSEGERVAAAILEAVPRVSDRRYRQLDRFRRALAMAYLPKAKLSATLDETIICRCEELTVGDLRAVSDLAGSDLSRIKSMTRLGMGRCQGRNCLHSAAAILGRENLSDEGLSPLPRIRPPIRPVRLKDIIAETPIDPAKEPDESNAFAAKETTQ